MKYIFLSTLWILWCSLHSFLTSTKTTAWFKGRLGSKFDFYRIFYNLFSLITVLPLFYWQGTIPGPVIIRLSPFLLTIKYTALILSAAVIAGSFFGFDVLEFLGIRQIIKKRTKEEGREQKLEKPPVISKHGFYAVVRHPMYLGGLIFFTALMMHAPFAQFLGYFILAIYMIIGTVREDRRLARELGDVYRNYQKEVPMFLPRFTGKRE